jgi:hypothetical protein
MKKEEKKSMSYSVGSALSRVPDHITAVRDICTENLVRMLPEDKHTFSEKAKIMIHIEEEDRLFLATAIDKDVVFLSDGTEVDLGDVKTDDLYTLVDTVHTELFHQD